MNRKIMIFMLMVLLLSLFYVPYAFAEGSDDSKITSNIDATARYFITDDDTIIYTCPVKKNHVTVAWDNSSGPTKIRVSIYILNNNWEWLCSYDSINLGGSHSFDLVTPHRYRVKVKKLEGYDGNCHFTITAS